MPTALNQLSVAEPLPGKPSVTNDSMANKPPINENGDFKPMARPPTLGSMRVSAAPTSTTIPANTASSLPPYQLARVCRGDCCQDSEQPINMKKKPVDTDGSHQSPTGGGINQRQTKAASPKAASTSPAAPR